MHWFRLVGCMVFLRVLGDSFLDWFGQCVCLVIINRAVFVGDLLQLDVQAPHFSENRDPGRRRRRGGDVC